MTSYEHDWVVIAEAMTEDGLQVEAHGSMSKGKADLEATWIIRRPEVERVVVTRLIRPTVEEIDHDKMVEESDWPEILNEVDPDFVVGTGIEDGTAARRLEIYYLLGRGRDWTFVMPSGEHMNAAPWRFMGRVDPELVREEYMKNISEGAGI